MKRTRPGSAVMQVRMPGTLREDFAKACKQLGYASSSHAVIEQVNRIIDKVKRMSGTVWHIQKLDGYTDGKPSWIKERVPAYVTWARERAEQAVAILREQNPTRKYRIRQVKRP
jgi:hypothetical protein